MDIYNMVLGEKFETIIKISNKTNNPNDNRDIYILEIKRTSTGWVYYISNRITHELIHLDVVPYGGNLELDNIYNLELHEFKFLKDENKTGNSVYRVHNGWINFLYDSNSLNLKNIYYVPQFLTTGTGSGPTYTNSTPLPVTHGGALAGTTFDNMTMQEMFDLILYPYQSPAFNNFYLLSLSGTFEIGFDIPTNQTFNWDTSHDANVKPNSIQISGNNLTTLTGLVNDNTEDVVFDSIITRNSTDGPGTRLWTIQAENTNNVSFHRNYSIRWDYMFYAGTGTMTSLTESDVKSLSDYHLLKNGMSGSYTLSAGGYKYIAVADVYPSPSRFYDPDSTFDVDMYDGYSNPETGSSQDWSYDLVSITNSEGETTNYRIYRTTNQLGGTQKINVVV